MFLIQGKKRGPKSGTEFLKQSLLSLVSDAGIVASIALHPTAHRVDVKRVFVGFPHNATIALSARTSEVCRYNTLHVPY